MFLEERSDLDKELIFILGQMHQISYYLVSFHRLDSFTTNWSDRIWEQKYKNIFLNTKVKNVLGGSKTYKDGSIISFILNQFRMDLDQITIIYPY